MFILLTRDGGHQKSTHDGCLDFSTWCPCAPQTSKYMRQSAASLLTHVKPPPRTAVCLASVPVRRATPLHNAAPHRNSTHVRPRHQAHFMTRLKPACNNIATTPSAGLWPCLAVTSRTYRCGSSSKSSSRPPPRWWSFSAPARRRRRRRSPCPRTGSHPSTSRGCSSYLILILS